MGVRQDEEFCARPWRPSAELATYHARNSRLAVSMRHNVCDGRLLIRGAAKSGGPWHAAFMRGGGSAKPKSEINKENIHVPLCQLPALAGWPPLYAKQHSWPASCLLSAAG